MAQRVCYGLTGLLLKAVICDTIGTTQTPRARNHPQKAEKIDDRVPVELLSVTILPRILVLYGLHALVKAGP